MPKYRSRTTTHGRNMAGARGLWRATGMKDSDFGKPIIAVANSFTQFVPGHVHLKDLGQLVAREIEAAGGVAKEFNTIAVDDGIAMGHDGMLYSLPSREIIADSVEYMVNAHCADAMVCISNCDKITPGMLMAAMRLNIPAVFVSGGPMEAGKVMLKGKAEALDLVDAMVAAADDAVTDEDVKVIERSACPTCGSCSGMFTANSMNCLTEALGLSLPGNGSTLATHADRKRLFVEAGHLIVDLARRYYEQDDASVLPRSIASFACVRKRHVARHRDGRLDQYRAAPAGGGAGGRGAVHDGGYRPAVAARAVPLQGGAVEIGRAYGGRAPRRRDHGHSGRARSGGADQYRARRPSTPRRSATRWRAGTSASTDEQRGARFLPRRAGRRADAGGLQPGSPLRRRSTPTARPASSAMPSMPSPRTAGSPSSTAISPRTAHREDRRRRSRRSWSSPARRGSSRARTPRSPASSAATVKAGDVVSSATRDRAAAPACRRCSTRRAT